MLIFVAIMQFTGCTEATPLTEDERKAALTLEIKPEKEQFALKEQRFGIKIIFKNHLSKPIRINRAYNFFQTESELFFEVHSSPGEPPQKIKVLIRRPNLNKKDFPKINGNGIFEIEEDLRHFLQFGESGKYTVSAVYFNKDEGKEFGFNAWTGEIRSNPVNFEIIN